MEDRANSLKNNKLVYYAHCRALYGTKQELRDISLLNSLGYEILNPNESIHQVDCEKCDDVMEYFKKLVLTCDVLAFRALPFGIPQGVYKEIQYAENNNIPVFELPINVGLRELTRAETDSYLTEVGFK